MILSFIFLQLFDLPDFQKKKPSASINNIYKTPIGFKKFIIWALPRIIC